MAEKLVNEIKDDFLTCKLCNNTFSDPKALPCLHTFCKGCLVEHINRHKVQAGDGTYCVFCPTCRQVCDLPRNTADGLQDNHLLGSLLDTLHSHTTKNCDLCSEDGKSAPASYVCIRCEDFLCDECSRSHKRTRLTRDHLVMKITSMRDIYNSAQKKSGGQLLVRLLARFGHYGDSLCNPISVDVNSANDIIVSNDNNTVSVFSIVGDYKKSINQNLFYGLEKNCLPSKCATLTAEGYIAVAMRKDRTSSSAQVCVLESFANREVAVCNARMGNPKDSEPYGIAVMKNNNIVVTDAGRHCVYIFNPEYDMVKQFGKRGSKNTQFKYPFHVTIGPNDEVIVSDYGNHCIKMFDSRGKFKLKFGTMGNADGELLHPVGLCADQDGSIFVCDRDNHRVEMFDPKGAFMTHIIRNSCRDSLDIRPQDVAITTQRHLVILLKGVEGVDFSQIHIYQYLSSASSSNSVTLDEETTQQLYSLRASIDSINFLAPRRGKGSLPPLDTGKGTKKPDRSDVSHPAYGSYGVGNTSKPSAPTEGPNVGESMMDRRPDLVPRDDRYQGARSARSQTTGHKRQQPDSSVCVIL